MLPVRQPHQRQPGSYLHVAIHTHITNEMLNAVSSVCCLNADALPRQSLVL